MAKSARVSRRKFIKYAIIAGAGALISYDLISSDSKPADTDARSDAPLNDDSILVKNPAYKKKRSSGSVYLLTTKADGKQLAFKIDSDAEYLWDHIGDVWEYDKKKRTSFGLLMEDISKRFPEGRQLDARKEAADFISKALKHGIISQEKNSRSIFVEKEKKK